MMNFRNFAGAALLGLASMTVAIAPANAAACRGPNGRFTKCPASAALQAKAPARRTAAANYGKPRTMAQVAAPARVQTATVTHRAVPKTVMVPVKATAAHAKAARPAAAITPKKG